MTEKSGITWWGTGTGRLCAERDGYVVHIQLTPAEWADQYTLRHLENVMSEMLEVAASGRSARAAADLITYGSATFRR